MNSINSSGHDLSGNEGSISYSVGQIFYSNLENSSHLLAEGIQQSQQENSIDNGNPTITCPGDINQNVDTGSSGALVTFTNPVGTDNAPGAVTTQIDGPASGDVFPIGTTTVTFQVKDTSGNIDTCSFDVTIDDNENPTITCPDDINQNVDSGTSGAVVIFTNPVGTDNASGAVTTQIDGPASGDVFPIGTTTVTFQVIDASSNTDTCSFDVTINDNENPIITCPGDINQNIDSGTSGAVVTFTNPVGTDNASGAVTTQIDGPVSGDVFPIGTTTVTFQVKDASGNIDTCSFDVIVNDSDEIPTITCPGDINLNTDPGVSGAVVTFTNPVGTDNASGAVTTQIDGPASGDVFPIGTTTVTFQVLDASDNSATCSFDVTINDNENPTITCLSDVNLNADPGVSGAVVTFTNPVGTDNASGAVTTQIDGPASGDVFPIGTTTVTFQVLDASDNSATCSFDVTINDNENPTITCPGDINLNTDPGVSGAVVTFTNPVGNDNTTGAVTTQIDGPESGDVFPIGTTTVTFQVLDTSGNTDTCSFDVTIIDNENPTITCPGDINQNVDSGTSGAMVTYTSPVGTDNASGAVTTQIDGPASGDVFPIGTTTVTFQVKDTSGNIDTCSFDVTIDDNENPTITCLSDVNLNADPGVSGAVVTFTNPVGTDNAPGAVTTQIDGPASGDVFLIGTTTVTFQVLDASGNGTRCSFYVTINDNENPTITCLGDINQNVDSGTSGAMVTYTSPVGTDNASGAVTTQIDGPASGDVFPIGTTTVTFQVLDASGNIDICSFDVTIIDNENPTITCPGDINLNADPGTSGAMVTFTNPVGTDNASGAVTTQIDGPTSGDVFPIGTTTVTFQVLDASGNIDTCSFDVTINDNENPTITCPSDINQNADPGVSGAVVTFTNPVGTDNASGAVTTQIDGPASGDVFPIGTTTVTFQVLDASGNIDICSFDVTIIDNENPTITCPGDINLNTDSGVSGAVVTFTNPVGTDNASGAVTTQIDGPASGDVFPIGTTTVTFQVLDTSGNIDTCSFDVTIDDNENPTITCPSDINQNVDPGSSGAMVTFTNPVGTDNAPGAVTTQIDGPVSGDVFPIGITTVTFQVLDTSGNIDTCSFNVTIIDNENSGTPEDNDSPEDKLTTEINVLVYPNPTTDFVSLVANGFNFNNNLNSYQLYNYQGKLIRSSLIKQTNTTIDFSNLSTSIYLLQVFNQEKLFKTIKIVKK